MYQCIFICFPTIHPSRVRPILAGHVFQRQSYGQVVGRPTIIKTNDTARHQPKPLVYASPHLRPYQAIIHCSCRALYMLHRSALTAVWPVCYAKSCSSKMVECTPKGAAPSIGIYCYKTHPKVRSLGLGKECKND